MHREREGRRIWHQVPALTALVQLMAFELNSPKFALCQVPVKSIAVHVGATKGLERGGRDPNHGVEMKGVEDSPPSYKPSWYIPLYNK